MTTTAPITSLDQRYSSDGAEATPWSEAERLLHDAKIFWISTVRPDGRLHVTPLIAIWNDGALFFCTGADERKAGNLAENPNCVITTGCNSYDHGVDLVLEGAATLVTDEPALRSIAGLYKSKYDWDFSVRDGRFVGDVGNVADLYQVRPKTAFGFGKGDSFSQTRWTFGE